MLKGLKVYDFSPEIAINHLDFADHFVLKTCQRTLIFGYKQWQQNCSYAPKAQYEDELGYTFILETICGLQSRLCGENEITGQFKEQYQLYLSQPYSNKLIVSTLEKIFKDAKTIRTQFLKNIGMQSYAGMTRLLLNQNQAESPVVITGSGALASDLVKALKKHYSLEIIARNTEKASRFELPLRNWNELDQLIQCPFIVNTIGTDSILFDEKFFQAWKKLHGAKCLFIDLGSPSVLKTSFMREDQVYQLSDLFALAESLDQVKELKIKEARNACRELADKRLANYSFNLPYGWDDVQLFA